MRLCLLILILLTGPAAFSQKTGINETNPKATLEIKSLISSTDSNALMIRNSTNDTLLKLNNAGTTVIGSVQRDFGQLQIISNAKLGYTNLQLTGTNFGGNTGVHFSDLVFNGTTSDKYWRLVSRVSGPDASSSNYSKNNAFTIHTDSLPFLFSLLGDGKAGFGTNSPGAYLEIRNDASDATGVIPHIKLTGTGLANRSYIYYSTADAAHNWFQRAQYNVSGGNYILGLDNNIFYSVTETGLTNLGGGVGTNKGQVNINYNSTASNAHLLLYETDASDYARLMFQNASSTSDNWQILGLLDASSANSRMHFYNSAGGNIMSLTGDGKVGIGNSSPSLAGFVADTKVGAVNSLFGSNTTGVAIESSFPGIGLNSYYNAGRKLISAGYGGYIGMDPTNGKLIFSNSSSSGIAGAATSTTDRMYIINSGEVGINKTPGITANDSKLQVKQSGSQNGIGIEAAGTTNHWDFYVNASNNLLLYYNGTLKGTYDNVSGGYTANSDNRLKKDISALPLLNSKLLQLPVYSYHYIDNNSNDPYSFGFMAQDVQKIFPDAVREIDMKDGSKRLGINYQYFTVLAVKGLQEQQQQISSLEERISKLEKLLGSQQKN